MPKKFLELYFDPGSKNLGQALVSLKVDADEDVDTNYQTEHVNTIDCVGTGKSSDTGLVLTNLSRYLSTDPTIKKFIEMNKETSKYDAEVSLESQEGISNGQFWLANAMIKMGAVTGVLYEFFHSKGIKVVFVPKQSKWGYVKTGRKKKVASGGVAKGKAHKKNTSNIAVDILERQNTKKSRAVLRWFRKNKAKSQHAKDSILGGMHRIQQRKKSVKL